MPGRNEWEAARAAVLMRYRRARETGVAPVAALAMIRSHIAVVEAQVACLEFVGSEEWRRIARRLGGLVASWGAALDRYEVAAIRLQTARLTREVTRS